MAFWVLGHYFGQTLLMLLFYVHVQLEIAKTEGTVQSWILVLAIP